MDISNLKRVSVLTYALERMFFLLQYTSLANIAFGTRSRSMGSPEIIRRRARNIELYFIAWLIVDITCALTVALRIQEFVKLAVWLSLFHVFEMCHVAINIGIFDALRIAKRSHYMASGERLVIMSAVNFIQLCLCFATYYAAHPKGFGGAGIATWGDAFYFSAATQLTIGYGDILPLGYFRVVAALQAFIGFFFAIAVLARFISILSNPVVMGDGHQLQQREE